MDIALRKLGDELKRLRREEPSKVLEILKQLSEQEAQQIFYCWEIWARDNQIIKDYHEGWPESVIVYMIGRGGGKAFCDLTPVLTENRGWVTMGEITTGDRVFDENGAPCNVLAKHKPDIKKMYDLEFSDGSVLKACDEHRWVTWTHRDRKQWLRNGNELYPEDWVNSDISLRDSWGNVTEVIGPSIKTTQEIVDTFTYSPRGDLNHSIPLTKSLKIKPSDLVVDPYLFGCWLGDGASSEGMIGTHVNDYEEMLSNFKQYKWNSKKQASANLVYLRPEKEGRSNPLAADLRKIGSFKSKIIPEVYLMASADQRLALLQGLMDTDGYSSGKSVEFCSIRKDHAESVLFLARSLGFLPTIKESDAKLYGRITSKRYRVTWSNPHNGLCPFRLKRKADVWNSTKGKTQLSRKRHRMIKSFREVPVVPAHCITVDSPNNMWLVGKELIPTHNSRLGSEWVRKKGCRKPTEIALIGPTAAKVRDVQVLGPSGIISVHPPIEAPLYEPSYARVSWKNGSVAKMFSAEKGDRVRGGNFELAWYDEVGEVFDEDPFDQAMFALRIGESRMLVTTTPRLGNPTLMTLWKNAVFNNDPPQEGKNVRIITGSTYENIDNLSATFKHQVLTKYEGTRLGRQEIEGVMLFESEGALWTADTIMKQTVDKDFVLPRMERVCIGVDPAVSNTKKSDKTGIILCGITEDKVGYVIEDHTEKYSPQAWVRRVHDLYDQWSGHCPVSIIVEKNQGGDMVRSSLTQDRPFLPVDTIFHTTNKLARAEPVAMLYEQGKIYHVRGLTELEQEQTTYEGSPKQKSPDRLDAMCMAMTKLMVGSKRFVMQSELLM